MAGEWGAAPLDDLVDDILDRRGVTPLKLGSDFVTSGYRVISAKAIKGRRVDLAADEARFVDESTYRKWMKTPLVADDVILTSEAPLGEPAYVADDVEWCLGQRLFGIRTKKTRLHGRFLFYVLQSKQVRHDLLSRATGTTAQGIRQTELRRIQVPLPTMAEQRAIAHILGALDDKIELNRQISATLESIAQALFKSWFVDFDPVRAKAEGRDPGLRKPLADLFPDSFENSELGEIPRGWCAQPLYDLATYINGAAYAAFQPNDDLRGLPIVKIAELKAGVTSQTKFSDMQMPEKYRITSGDILFSWSGNPDTSIDTFVWSAGPAWLNQHIFRVLPRRPQERAFVLATLKTLRPVFAEIARNKQTTGLGHVTAHDMKRLFIARPDDGVLSAWSKMASPLHERAYQNALEIARLSKVRDVLLPKLISGELRVGDAAGICERIHA